MWISSIARLWPVSRLTKLRCTRRARSLRGVTLGELRGSLVQRWRRSSASFVGRSNGVKEERSCRAGLGQDLCATLASSFDLCVFINDLGLLKVYLGFGR